MADGIARVVNTYSFNHSVYVVYLCEKAGDEIPLHSHTFNHITIALKGEIEVFTETGPKGRAKSGESPFEYTAGQQHGIRGVTDGTMFVNVSPELT